MEQIKKIPSKIEKNIISKKDFMKNYPEFFRHIGDRKASEEGTVSRENENLKLSFKFEELSNLSSEDLSRVGLVCAVEDSLPEDYFILKNFKLKNKNTEFDLTAEAEDVIVLFRKDPIQAVKGSAYSIENVVSLGSIPSSPQSIGTLMHELGHLKDPDTEEDQIRFLKLRPKNVMAGDDYNQRAEKERNALKLKQERTAWAYGLNKLRPFIRDFNIPEESFKKFVHDFSLGSYCKNMGISSEK